MHTSLRVVTRFPTVELWRDDGFVTGQRSSSLAAEHIVALLQQNQVRFVVASVGKPLRWVAPAECFAFWKDKVRSHLAAPEARIFLSEYPDEYCYLASQWSGEQLPIILLETYH